MTGWSCSARYCVIDAMRMSGIARIRSTSWRMRSARKLKNSTESPMRDECISVPGRMQPSASRRMGVKNSSVCPAESRSASSVDTLDLLDAVQAVPLVKASTATPVLSHRLSRSMA